MALLAPFKYTLTQGWGPSARADEPFGFAMLGRFWWTAPRITGFRAYQHFHPGLDLAAKEGTPIHASEAGTVTAAGLHGVSGIRIEVTIRPGTLYVHGHMSKLASGMAVGAKVKRGQVIGYVGHTGGATGPHSHFGVQSIVPATRQSMIYDPSLFFEGGANANDVRIHPL